eukprot:scaffold11733_cov158-Isochrysis_galbana.AAC.2
MTAARERRWEWWCMKERWLEVGHRQPYRVRSIAEVPDARLERHEADFGVAGESVDVLTKAGCHPTHPGVVTEGAVLWEAALVGWAHP